MRWRTWPCSWCYGKCCCRSRLIGRTALTSEAASRQSERELLVVPLRVTWRSLDRPLLLCMRCACVFVCPVPTTLLYMRSVCVCVSCAMPGTGAPWSSTESSPPAPSPPSYSTGKGGRHPNRPHRHCIRPFPASPSPRRSLYAGATTPGALLQLPLTLVLCVSLSCPLSGLASSPHDSVYIATGLSVLSGLISEYVSSTHTMPETARVQNECFRLLPLKSFHSGHALNPKP